MRISGAILVLAAAILESAKHIAAALYLNETSEWSEEMFRTGLEYVGNELSFCAIACGAVGFALIAYGVIKSLHQTK